MKSLYSFALGLGLAAALAAPLTAAVIADSVTGWSASGTQGENNWINGWYNRTDDLNGVYEVGDLNLFNNLGTAPAVAPSGNHWNGSAWDLQDGTTDAGDPLGGQANVPWTFQGQQDVHPNGTNQAAPNNKEHWTVRRWISDVDSDVILTWHTRKTNAAGNGVGGNLYVNGQLLDSTIIHQNNTHGVTRSVRWHVSPGDLVDLALTPNGADGSDGSANRLTISTVTDLGNSMAEFTRTGTQGERNWFSGWYNRTDDPDGIYSVGDLNVFNNLGTGPGVAPSGNHWNGSAWDLQDGTTDAGDPLGGQANVPWSTISRVEVHPNGTNQAAPNNKEHWVVRRWVAGDLTQTTPVGIRWFTYKPNAAGTGVTAKLFVNGVEVDGGPVAGADFVGLNRVYYANLNPGDVVDLALTPVGKNGAAVDVTDGSDTTSNGFSIEPIVPAGAANRRRLADSFADFSGNQGQDNWFYGYYDRTADLAAAGDGIYQEGEMQLFPGGPADGAWSDTNHWTGTIWDFNPPGASTGNPSWLAMTNIDQHPNDNNPGPEHYAVRRYVAEEDGATIVEGFFRRQATGADGTLNKIFHNGTEIFSDFSQGGTLAFSLNLNLAIGDRLDFVTTTRDPANDGSDNTQIRVLIEKAVPFTPIPEPSSVALALLAGSAGLWFAARRRRTAIAG